VKFREISSERTGEDSATIRERVVAARTRQHARFANKRAVTCNARMGPRELKNYCALDEPTKELLKFAMSDLNLSARVRPHPQGRPHYRRLGWRGKDCRGSYLRGDPVSVA
jgi:predicted ATPase with chaperone activity